MIKKLKLKRNKIATSREIPKYHPLLISKYIQSIQSIIQVKITYLELNDYKFVQHR